MRNQPSATGTAGEQVLGHRIAHEKFSGITHRSRAEAIVITALDHNIDDARIAR